jgi:small nuclear ribonucleoprotein (snRNP)-like protein
MKLTTLGTLVVLFIITHNVANAGERIEIDLVDGTVISGKLVSFDDGIYTIHSTTLGTLKIREKNVRSIHNMTLAEETTPDIGTPNGIQSLQQRLLADEDIMKMITSLLQDPDFQEILQDQALMKAISSGDLSTLISDPKFQKLLNKSTVEQIKEKLEQ